MYSGIEALENSYYYLFIIVLIILAVMLFLCLLRACLGPTVADRLVAVNMMGTMVNVIIATLAIMMGEGYLVDISLIYTMLSFLAVIVLSKVILGIHKQDTERYADLTTDEDELVEQEEEERRAIEQKAAELDTAGKKFTERKLTEQEGRS